MTGLLGLPILKNPVIRQIRVLFKDYHLNHV